MKTAHTFMKKAIVLVTAPVLLALTVGVAQAEVCYKLSPFVDILRLSIHSDVGASGDTHQAVFGNWIAHGSYAMPVTGARELDKNSTTVRRLGIHATNNTTSFASNKACMLDGIPGGTWRLSCNNPGPVFANSGTLTPITCPATPVSSPEGPGGRPAGG